MFEKVWDDHVVVPETADTPAVLFIDLHLTHEVTTPQAYTELRERGLKLRRPDLTLATMDHSTPTRTEQVFGGVPIAVDSAAKQVRQLEINAQEFGVELFNLQDSRRGIVHIIGPELGITQPGKTIVCGDSHTSTHGAFGALAFGIGTTEVGHVLATQCLLQRRPKTFAINVTGRLAPGVTAKDLILAIIGKIGVSGGTGHVLEFRGAAIEAMSMDERMTICNMSIEAGARAGMIAPDATTFEYLAATPRAPKGADWDAAVARWSKLPTDAGATLRSLCRHRCQRRSCPWSPTALIPAWSRRLPASVPAQGDAVFEKALKYMGLTAGEPIGNVPVNNVFVGSCTNGRLSDLRNAARVLRGHKLAQGVKMLVVPGSQAVKRAAEAEGLRPGVPRRRRRMARERLLDVPRHERRPRTHRATIPSAPAIAISKAARARARARCSPVPKPRPRRPFAAASPIHANSPTDTHACRKDHSLTHGRVARDQRRHRPDHSGAVSHLHFEGRFRQTSVRRLALRRRGQSEARLRAEQTRSQGRRHPRGRPQHRLRVFT